MNGRAWCFNGSSCTLACSSSRHCNQGPTWETTGHMISWCLLLCSQRWCPGIILKPWHPHYLVVNLIEHDAGNQLWKLQPVLDEVGVCVKQACHCWWELVGLQRSSLNPAVQPEKRARQGLKVYKLCSSDGPEAGYITAFKIYMGQDCREFISSIKDPGSLPLPADPWDKCCWYSTYHQEGSAIRSSHEPGQDQPPQHCDGNALPSVGWQASSYEALHLSH